MFLSCFSVVAVAPHVYSPGSLNSCSYLPTMTGTEPIFSIPPPTSIPYSSAPNIKMEYKPESHPSCSSAGFSPLSLTPMTYCVPSTTLSEVNQRRSVISNPPFPKGASNGPSYVSYARMGSVGLLGLPHLITSLRQLATAVVTGLHC